MASNQLPSATNGPAGTTPVPPVPGVRTENNPQAPRTTKVSQSTKEALGNMQVQERDYSGLIELDTETLDPNFSYRWVYKGPTKVARAKAKGYVVVDANDEDIKNLIGEDIASQDATYTVGDVLLMKIRKIRFKERRRVVAEKTKSRLSSQRRKFKRNAQEKQEQSGYDIEVITKKDPSDNKD